MKNLKNLSAFLSWKSVGRLQQTLASEIVLSGVALHSGTYSTVKIFPAMAGEGRVFICGNKRTEIPASIDFVTDTPRCTTLCRDGTSVRTVEHLLSALEASGVDNCRIEVTGANEIPLLDGSAKEWVNAIRETGLCIARDCDDKHIDKLAPVLSKAKHMEKGDSYIAAFPSSKVHIRCGIYFPDVPAISSQWFSCFPMEDSVYAEEIASSRTFCIYEEVETLLKAGLIQGGSVEAAIVCSASSGWLNPPLRFKNEPCRHKVLDLIGDLSLLARHGHQGLPMAHILVYKGGHSLHVEFAKLLRDSFHVY